jgi:AbrB family looped-hinge helix DNA binding protein
MTGDSSLTSKGQTTIPKVIRDGLSLRSGDLLTFTMMPDGTVLMRAKNKSAMRLAGALKRKGGKSMMVDQLSR